jgi:hypothetical protein
VRVQLVDQRARHVETVERVAIGGERPEGRAGFAHRDRLAVELAGEVGAKVGLEPRHLLRDVEDDARLLFLGRRRVHLGADLAVGDEHVEADRRELGGLRVLARHFLVHRAEAPAAVDLPHPAEDARQAEFLRRHQADRRARAPVRAVLHVRQELDEADHAIGELGLPVERPLRVVLPAIEIIELPAARRLHPLAGRREPGKHVLRVLERVGYVVGLLNCAHPSSWGLSMPGREAWLPAVSDGVTRVRAAGDMPNSARNLAMNSSARLRICICTEICR